MNSETQKGFSKDSFILHDVSIIALSVVFAIVLVRSNLLNEVLGVAKELNVLGSFIAGMFFTSIFTTAPAIVTLGQIAKTNSLLLTALFGAFGAVLGDMLIFRFVKDKIAEHVMELVAHQGVSKRMKALFRLKTFRWLTFLLGGLILASPFPDELGISILGFMHVKTSWFIPISFVFNFIGILLIGLVARGL